MGIPDSLVDIIKQMGPTHVTDKLLSECSPLVNNSEPHDHCVLAAQLDALVVTMCRHQRTRILDHKYFEWRTFESMGPSLY